MPPPILVLLTPYNPSWPGMAAKCGEGLQVLASTLVAVHHIGSTSVPGLAAKPIIDLMPVVTRLDALPHAYTDEKAAWIERTQGKALAWFDKLP